MARSSFEPVRLRVQASDPGTEIFLVDGSLKRIASGAGRIDVEVEPGLYKVRLRSGSTQRDEILSVEPGAGEVFHRAEPVKFHSAAPLSETRTTHEYHSHPAQSLSRGPALGRGSGSGLFLFLREEDREAPALQVDSVTVRDLEGEEIAGLGDGDLDREWGWAALNLELNPGTYRIRVDTGPLGSYDLFVTTAQGWQTQAFLITEDFRSGSSKVRGPSLRQASLLMAPMGAGFEAHSHDTRVSELARQALAQGRQALDQEAMEQLLHGKFHDPMLGIYAAHLLLLERRIRWSLLEHVCQNLYGLMGSHPDLQALFLRLGERSPGSSRVETLDGVPTLRGSWDLMVAASRRRPSLIPRGSILAIVAEDLASTKPYLIYRVGRVSTADSVLSEPAVSRGEALKQASELLEGEDGGISELRSRVQAEDISLSGLEQTLLGAMISTVVEGAEIAVDEESAGTKPTSAQKRLRRAMAGVKAPPAAVSGSLARLVRKLERD